MQDGSAKQLVTERIKNATNILVTVSANPSVDELSAALGLTMMLNKLDKHGTAVFSGQLPPAINFLEPAKTFESTVDSLRDFIIALDKEKADRLRYKVEDDVVRIFITPYRTTITQNDLDFSQGDFNVELIIALGVEKREDLDAAIVAHGRILHDATVVTINARDGKSTLGSVDWQDNNASSLCEMLVSISEALGSGLLDQQIANALLTGIVAATDRFSNIHTTPRVMTMAAQLMAAGANQQLIATQLEEAHEIPKPNNDGSTSLKEGSSEKVNKPAKKKKSGADGEMQIAHDPTTERSAAAAAVASQLAEAAETKVEATHEEALTKQLDSVVPAHTALPDVHDAIRAETASYNPLHDEPEIKATPSWKGRNIEPPTMGGILNATTEEAMEEARDAEADARNHKLLSHDSHAAPPATPPPAFNNYSEGVPVNEGISDIDTSNEKAPEPVVEDKPQAPATINDLPMPAYEPTPEPAPAPKAPPVFEAMNPGGGPTLADLDAQARGHANEKPKDTDSATLAELEAQAHAHAAEASEGSQYVQNTDVDQARAAVTDIFSTMPFDPARNPVESLGANPLPAINDRPVAAPEQLQPVAPPAPHPDFSLPPLPDMGTLPPLPPNAITHEPSSGYGLPQESPLDQVTDPNSTNPDQGDAPSGSNDPGQFKIPGQ